MSQHSESSHQSVRLISISNFKNPKSRCYNTTAITIFLTIKTHMDVLELLVAAASMTPNPNIYTKVKNYM